MSKKEKEFGILKMLSGRYVAKKWIEKITKSRVLNEDSLTLIWVSFLRVRFAIEGGEVKNLLELCYKFEIWCVSTHTYVVSENMLFSNKNL